MRSAVQIKSLAYKLTKANNSRSTLTHQLTSSSIQNTKTQKLTSPSTYKLKKTSTYQRTKLKIVTFILQYFFKIHSVLAKIQAIKLVKIHFLCPFTAWNLSNFKPATCILHHFAFLDWLPTHNFSGPKTHFQPLKSHFLTAILPFLVMCLML